LQHTNRGPAGKKRHGDDPFLTAWELSAPTNRVSNRSEKQLLHNIS
jgi:hypothetical protein